jgi:hypothetical protein
MRRLNVPVWGWMLLPLLLLTALGARSLDVDMLWFDEYASLGRLGGFAGIPPRSLTEIGIWTARYTPDHVPGYFWLLRIWAELVGWSPFALRALSLLCGLLAAAWVYRAGRIWLGPRVGLAAALLLATNAFFIYYTHEMRMYALIVLSAVFVLWAYRRAAYHARPPWWLWPALFTGLLSLFYVHMFSAILLAALGLYHLIAAPRRRAWWALTGLFVLVGLLALLWLPVVMSGGQMRIARAQRSLYSGAPPLELVSLLIQWLSNGAAVLIVLAAVLAVRLRPMRSLLFLALLALLLTLAANAVLQVVQIVESRYLLFMWPALLVILSGGLVMLANQYRRLGISLLLVWAGLGIVQTFNPAFLSAQGGQYWMQGSPPLPEVHDTLKPIISRADLLMLAANRNHVVRPYYDLPTMTQYYLGDLPATGWYFMPHPADTAALVRPGIVEQTDKRLTVWLVTIPEVEGVMQVYREVLQEQYDRCETVVDAPNWRLERYIRQGFNCPPLVPDRADLAVFSAGVRLHDLRFHPQQDAGLQLAAAWTVEDTIPPDTYSVSFKLWQGAPLAAPQVAQVDLGLREAGTGWQWAVIPLTNVPPGTYTLTVSVYDWQTGQSLTSPDGSTTLNLTTVTLPAVIEASRPDDSI